MRKTLALISDLHTVVNIRKYMCVLPRAPPHNTRHDFCYTGCANHSQHQLLHSIGKSSRSPGSSRVLGYPSPFLLDQFLLDLRSLREGRW